VLHDLGYVSTSEPFRRLFHQGVITSYAYQRADKSLLPNDEVEARDDRFFERATGQAVTQVVYKMAKSLKNIVSPDEVIAAYGADTFRLYEMYLGPLEASKPWNTNDTSGMHRFLQRTFRVLIDEDSGELRLRAEPHLETERLLHRTIAKVGQDIEKLAFNTAIAAMIKLINLATGEGGFTQHQASRFLRMLGPFAPHLAEELWQRIGEQPPIALQPWPGFDQSQLRDDEVEIPIAIGGKVRAKMLVPADADAAALERLALSSSRVQELLEGKPIRKVIAVPGKMVNIVPGK
jgi:leucyl-tRNA synthetase